MNSRSMLCFALVAVAAALTSQGSVAANTIATATFDTDSYVWFGSNNDTAAGITTGTDFSGGVVSEANAHFNFGVVQFEDLSGLQTVANGGGSKFLTMDWMQIGAAQVGVSVAGDDYLTTYPPGVDFGNNAPFAEARLTWYHDNIKGDDASFGGYAGGAQHVGAFDLLGQGAYSIDVTAIVDAWIDNPSSNHGFGLWAVSSAGAQGSSLDFASLESSAPFAGPRLTSIAIPEPTTAGLLAIGVVGLSAARRKRGVQ